MTIDRSFEKELHCNAAQGARQPLSAFANRFTAQRNARCSQRRRGRERGPQALRTGYVSRAPPAIEDSVDRERTVLVRLMVQLPFYSKPWSMEA